MTDSSGRGPSARFWRIVAGTLAGVLILAALLIGALRFVLAELPEHSARIQAWIERQTNYRLEFSGLDARMRWWGPEVVLRDLRVLDRDASQALFAAREGAVSLDLWNLFRTGELVAGRVRVVGPEITIVRLADGRIRVLGLRERPADSPPLELDRLPAGRLEVEDATVYFRDLAAGRGPWRLEDVQLSLRRAHDAVDVTGAVQLPSGFGTRCAFEGELRGSLDRREELDGRLDLRIDRLALAGFAELMPAGRGRPLSGAGTVSGTVSFARGQLQQLRLDLALEDVAWEVPARELPPLEVVQIAAPVRPPGASPLSMPMAERSIVERAAPPLPQQVGYASLAGRLRVRREGQYWSMRATDLRLDAPGERTRAAASIEARWRGHAVSAFSLEVSASSLDAAAAWPLALALAPPAFDRWAGLAPDGVVRTIDLAIVRDRAGSEPRFRIAADLVQLGTQPVGRWPGARGLTARLSGTEQRGRIALRAESPSFEWPRLFREPIRVARASGDIDWWRDDDAWVVASPQVVLEHPLAAAQGSVTLRIPGRGHSPYLDLDATVERLDATLVRGVLPVGRLQPRSIAWLEQAFQKGTASGGQLSYHGPVRKFPFRGGEGEFTARADVRDVSLVFYDGFAPITGAEGVLEMRNAGLNAKLASGSVGGLRLREGQVAIGDLKEPVIDVQAAGSGDLAKALAVLQGSPLGPQLGEQFMRLAGSGPADYTVQLHLPSQDIEARDYRVRARLHSVAISTPILRAPATGVTGELEIHNREFSAPSISGTILGGPFKGSVSPGPVGGEVTASVLFSGSGRAAGPGLPAFIGLPETIRMSGATDWQVTGRVERHGEGRQWPARVEVQSDLRGLGIDAPRPFAKEPALPRPTRVVLDVPQQGRTDVLVESGGARAALLFAERSDERWDLERGAARFDGRPVEMPARPGLHVGGDWPEFDLGEWLALRSEVPGTRHLGDWLGPVDVHLDRARVLGFEFGDVTARLEPYGDAWRILASGPMAEGTIIVPGDFAGTAPLDLDLRRLELRSAPVTAGAPATAERDPRDLPSVVARVDDLSWQGRRFGRMTARVDRVQRGLELSSLATESPAFTLTGSGSWLAEGDGSRTRLALEFASSDLAAASRALGYSDVVDAEKARVSADVSWSGGPSEDALGRLDGKLHLALDRGQLRNVKPGAGRMLGLMSVIELPRRLSFDFRDVTDEGLAFDTVRGDFEIRAGNAYTENLLLKGAAVDIGVVGRTGLAAQDYEQTVVVSGNPSGPITVAGALAGGPVGAAGALLFSQLFKGQLQGLARIYYRITGTWADPVVERISAAAGSSETAGSGDGKEKQP